ncbi:MAG: TauD/TfdA family dioxygenase [Nitrospinae bacterium]|nr:TauD/TfdA family dioxygenase [Nitrospinota bacterium]
MQNSPFHPENRAAYEKWRDEKLARHPARVEDLIVSVTDPRCITPAEKGAILERLSRANMAIYQSQLGTCADKRIPVSMMRSFGATEYDHNPESDDEGVTSLTPRSEEEWEGKAFEYIPYSSKAIQWHTDGYYNPVERLVRSLILHCAQQADEGGENELLDHEVMYILLREENPEHVRALMRPDAFTIPARVENGVTVRPEQSGPVFTVDQVDGRLYMRYTHRVKSIVWKNDVMTSGAVEAIRKILAGPNPYMFRARLAPGWGLLCNNVLHTRSAFATGQEAPKRLLYRIRSFNRLA